MIIPNDIEKTQQIELTFQSDYLLNVQFSSSNFLLALRNVLLDLTKHMDLILHGISYGYLIKPRAMIIKILS